VASMDRVFRSELLTAVWRFPLPVLCAIGATLIHWPIVDGSGEMALLSRFSLSFILAVAFFWSGAAALLGEATKRPLTSALVCIAGLIVIAYAFDLPRAFRIWLLWEPSNGWTNMRVPQLFLAGAIAVLPTLAPYTARSASQSAYWQFNHKLFVAFIAAAAGAIAAWIGWWAILETAQVLFGFEQTTDLLQKGATIAICLVGPLVGLILTPANFAEEVRSGADQEFTARAVALLVAYILIPVTVVLSGLLAGFVVKTLAEGTFLTSRLGFTSALYAGGIIGVALMAYPQRSESGYIGLFWRAFPYLLIAPTILLIPALWVRVAEYGWTPARYLALLTVIWVVVIAVAFVLPRWGDLRIIVGTAALLLALTAFGPWGVGPVSGRSQFALLEAHLVRSGWVVDGRWKGPEDSGSLPVRSPDVVKMRTALETLRAVDELDRLRPWFEGQDGDPFKDQTAFALPSLFAKMKITTCGALGSGEKRVSFRAETPYVIPVGAQGVLAGPVGLRAGSVARVTTIESTPLGGISVSFDGKRVTVEDSQGRKRELDLDPEFRAVGDGTSPGPIRLADGAGELPVRFAITELRGVVSENASNADTVVVYLLIATP
jgi:hypothetical protein